ncbi:MAG TPA: DciA family protein, partial [Terriglobia bacterium]|nr:DciA family protein [Terriglobia bacterium]
MEEIGKSLPVIFKRHIRKSGPAVAEILAPLWARVAGRAIAEHSRPVGFEAGQLLLETTCETWAGQ